ncbi:hypothetical protein GCM10025787_37980 [Saccharopolyspora rosea]
MSAAPTISPVSALPGEFTTRIENKAGNPEIRKSGNPENRGTVAEPRRANRWDTRDVRRRVLGVVRTLTALDRLLDVLPVLADDMRVETRFSIARGSEFSADLDDHLHRIGARIADWGEATPASFDFAISPSGNGPLHELGIPLMTLPHGAGHHKLRATDEGVATEVSGLSRTQLTHRGEVVPTVVGLSHDDQLDVLRRHCPEALPRAEVIGDPCFARLRASLPVREHYRDALGTEHRTLVLVASTWGGESLFGREGDLAAELVAELPAADYQVALVLHPNIWAKYGRYQIESWTWTARRRGLVLVPPLRSWQAALVAADVVVSDHGSLAFYAAALGTPLLLAAFGEHEIAPGSPMSLLGARAGRLRRGDLKSQLDGAQPVPDHDHLAAMAFQDRPYQRLRDVVYRCLELEPPSWPAAAEPVDVFSP